MQSVYHDLLNGVISNHLERPLSLVLRSWYFLSVGMSQNAAFYIVQLQCNMPLMHGPL